MTSGQLKPSLRSEWPPCWGWSEAVDSAPRGYWRREGVQGMRRPGDHNRWSGRWLVSKLSAIWMINSHYKAKGYSGSGGSSQPAMSGHMTRCKISPPSASISSFLKWSWLLTLADRDVGKLRKNYFTVHSTVSVTMSFLTPPTLTPIDHLRE